MRSVRTALAVLTLLGLTFLMTRSADAGETKPKFKRERLSKEQVKVLFAKLGKAAATAKTFHARTLRSELSKYVVEAEPLKFEGEVWAERPNCFRQQMSKPRKSLAVANASDLWVYFPESREAQHIKLAKSAADKSGTATESFMSWVTFDLEKIEKNYSVSVRTDKVPEGVTVRIAKLAKEGDPAPGADAKAAAPTKAYCITYRPKASHRKTSGIRSLKIWVDGENPWPLKIEKVTKSKATIVTEFRDIVLWEKLDPKLFTFKPPRGTKVEELSR
jgi:outer membrane lipoprotein-sorting protein